MFLRPFLLAGICLLLCSGCAITRNVQPVASGTQIDRIYVNKNPRVLMDGFHPEILSQIQSLGFEAVGYEGDKPKEARFYVTYTANWAWDMAMYLVYFRATLYDEGRVLGEVDYDAKMGGANMGKFGTTANKIRPLLTELLQNAKLMPAELTPAMGK